MQVTIHLPQARVWLASKAPNLKCIFFGRMTPNKWSETVRTLSALCAQKPRIHAEGEENLCLFGYNEDKLSPADRF